MQEIQDAGDVSTATAAEAWAEGLLENTDRIEWRRADWDEPVGHLSAITYVSKQLDYNGSTFHWGLVKVPELCLGHRAALQLLQGQLLSDLLLPNHSIGRAGFDVGPAGQVIVYVEPFEYWRSQPRLTELWLAYAKEPEKFNDQELLAKIVWEAVNERPPR